MLVRMKLYEEARNRGGGGGATRGPSWIPELSRLAGRVFDLVAVRVIDDYASRSSTIRRGGGGADEADERQGRGVCPWGGGGMATAAAAAA